MANFLTRTRGRQHGSKRLHWTDWMSYAYLLMGLLVMFGPVLWLVMSSFKTESALSQFPPSFLPYSQKEVVVAGHEKPLPLFTVKNAQGETRELAQVRRIGIMATMVDPAKPAAEPVRVNINDRTPINTLRFAPENYSDIFGKFAFGTFLWNSVFITVVATLITLLINSMAAFALSKYNFTGQKTVFVAIIATLMIPPTIILVPAFLVISELNLLNNLWGVILPAVATPTGVFLLRQYMLTIPDELIEAARMDNASEWRIYWKIMMPLSLPVLTTTSIFSFIWTWNDFLGPLVYLNDASNYTVPLALRSFMDSTGQSAWGQLFAMSVLAILPIFLFFLFFQRLIIEGVASSGMKHDFYCTPHNPVRRHRPEPQPHLRTNPRLAQCGGRTGRGLCRRR